MGDVFDFGPSKLPALEPTVLDPKRIRGGSERNRQLTAENQRLRAALHIDVPTTLQEWGTFAPQEWRDKMAADALINEKLNPFRALLRLGFSFDGGKTDPSYLAAAELVFNTPGVAEIMNRDFAAMDSQREAILKRLGQTAIHGEDAESTRAGATVARIRGWGVPAPGEAKNTPPITNILIALGVRTDVDTTVEQRTTPDPNETIDAQDFLAHTPGAATAVIDEDAPRGALVP
jgi:hypothetical protein